MQMKVRKACDALYGIDWRRRTGLAEAPRLRPANRVRQMKIVVVRTGIGARAGHRHRRNPLTPREQMNLPCSGFERRCCGIECGCRATDHRHGFAAQRSEIDRLRGVGKQCRRKTL